MLLLSFTLLGNYFPTEDQLIGLTTLNEKIEKANQERQSLLVFPPKVSIQSAYKLFTYKIMPLRNDEIKQE